MSAAAPLRVGVDIGGTRTKTVAARDGVVVARSMSATPRDVAHRLGPVVVDALSRVLAEVPGGAGTDDVAQVGVVVPGVVDESRCRAVWSANLGWRDLDVGAALAGHVPARVVLGHDVRAGLLGEHRAGAAVGVDDVLFVPLGTGLAAALMTRGQVVRGSAWTGEIGHVRVRADGARCGCGRRGCLEAVAGALAIGRAWQAAGREGDARVVAEAVSAGNPVAQAIWHEAIDALAGALAPVVATAGTRLVVVGGGLAQAGEVLLRPLTAALAEHLPDAGAVTDAEPVTVVRSGLGEWSGAVGAVHL